MKRVFQLVLLGTLILSACAVGISSTRTAPVSTTEAPTLPPATAGPNPTLIATLSTPHIEQPPNGEITAAPPNPQECAYQWAYQDLPELSKTFQYSMQALQAEAKANAYLFGENCILSDGSIGSFLPRETDFNVTLQVRDLNDESDLGSWVVKVMETITAIPPQQIVGLLPGTVFLMFQSGSDQKAINFGIDQYLNLSSNLSDAEIFQALQAPQ
jgi:hypothetical protein